MALAADNNAQAELAAALLGLDLCEPDVRVEGIMSALRSVDVSSSTLDVLERFIAAAQNSHELHFEIPALGLLPEGKAPYLRKPDNIEVRDCPVLSPKLDTSFSTRLPTDDIPSLSVVPAVEIDGNDVCGLADYMMRLHSAPGVTTFDFVEWDGGWSVLCRVKLTTTWQTAGGRSSETKTFSLDAKEWSDTLECFGEDGYEWPAIADHILHRRSDRAYFHVHEKLQIHNIEVALTDMTLWGEHWDSGRMHSPNHLLSYNITWQGSNESWEGTLPCGHTQAVPPLQAAYDMTEIEAQEFACDTCNAYVLSEEDYHQVLNLYDRRHRVKFQFDVQCWKALKARALTAEDKTFKVTHQELRTVFYEVAATFGEPESIVPGFMNLVDSSETLMLLQHLYSIFCNGETTVTVDTAASPEAYFDMFIENLCDNAGLGPNEDVADILPIGFEAFLHQWIQRVFLYLKTKEAHQEDELADKLMSMMLDNGKAAGGRKRKSDKGRQVQEDDGPQCFRV